MEIAQQMKIERFKASEGWLTNFKQRHPTLFGKPPNETLLIDNQPEEASEWQSTNSNELLVQLLGVIQNDNKEEKTEELEEEAIIDEEDPSEFEASDNRTEFECIESTEVQKIVASGKFAELLISKHRILDQPVQSFSTAHKFPPKISLQEAYTGFSALRQYIEENSVDNQLMQACHRIADFLYSERQKLRTNDAL
jgi:hypothetical protein